MLCPRCGNNIPDTANFCPKCGNTIEKNYTSGYMHLSSINVSVGDIVTPDTIIGAVGGNESYERCSTAVHLHFQLANGHIPPASEDDTGYYSRIVSKSFDPTTVVNFPGYLVRFKNRTNAY